MNGFDDWGAWLAAGLLLDVAMAGAAAASAGRALARGWRSFALAPLYMVLLAAAIGFLHYAIFGLSPIPIGDLWDSLIALGDSPLASLAQIARDGVGWAALTALFTLYAFIGYRMTRLGQMADRYDWLFERKGLWTWRRRETQPTDQ
jgi:hypothetical protein